MPGGRPVVTSLTPEQRKTLAAFAARDRRIQQALSTPQARAGHKFASYIGTAAEALRDLREVLGREGGSLLAEGAEMPVALFLSATANAESAWRREGLPVPPAAGRMLAERRAAYAATVRPARFGAFLSPAAVATAAAAARRALPAPTAPAAPSWPS